MAFNLLSYSHRVRVVVVCISILLKSKPSQHFSRLICFRLLLRFLLFMCSSCCHTWRTFNFLSWFNRFGWAYAGLYEHPVRSLTRSSFCMSWLVSIQAYVLWHTVNALYFSSFCLGFFFCCYIPLDSAFSDAYKQDFPQQRWEKKSSR